MELSPDPIDNDGLSCDWSAKDALGGADSALYRARMMLDGNGHDVWEMIVEKFP